MTQPKFKIKRGDFVQVMVGKDKGRRGVVEKVFLEDGKVLVEGIHRVLRRNRPSMDNPNGGSVWKTLPIHISNVLIVDPTLDEPSRVGYRIEDGKKVRFSKKSGVILEDFIPKREDKEKVIEG